MKNYFLKSVIALSCAFLISSCAFHTGYMSNSASLSSANFSYVKRNLQGESTATYIFGIGGLGKQTLVDDARIMIINNNPLKDNQTFANITVNFKSSFYLGVVSTVTCTITADIVEFK